MNITASILEKSGARREAVLFVKRNFPNGFDPDRIRATGSMRNWYLWITAREYDTRGNLTKETDPDGCVRLYEYDTMGHLTKETGPDGRIWLYEYDTMGNRTKHIYPGGGVHLYEYDYADNSLIEMREGGEKIVWFEQSELTKGGIL